VSARRWFAIRLLAVGVLGLLVGAGVVLIRKPADGRPLAVYSHRLAGANALLKRAEDAMRALAHQRHARLAGDSRCYYPTDAGEGGGQVAAVEPRLFCGPVLFVDGDASRPYLVYNLIAQPTSHGQLRLAMVGAQPDAVAAPPDQPLIRPDGRTPPARVGINPPGPPAAVGDVLTTTETLRTPLTPAPPSAVMVGQLSGVRLIEYGFVDVYDWGDRARTAPPGYRLLAFAVVPVPGEDGSSYPDLSVRVDGHARGPLTVTSDYLIAAVPKHARRVDLVLNDSGTTQAISLLTGRPAADNPAVTVRAHLSDRPDASRSVKVRLTTAAGSGTVTGTFTVRQVSLSYWTAAGTRCPRPDAAWLHVGAMLKLDGDKQFYGAESGLVWVTVPGGGKVGTSNGAADPAHQVDDVAQVPASLTRGTVLLSGTVHTAKGTLTVLGPVSVPFSIAAG